MILNSIYNKFNSIFSKQKGHDFKSLSKYDLSIGKKCYVKSRNLLFQKRNEYFPLPKGFHEKFRKKLYLEHSPFVHTLKEYQSNGEKWLHKSHTKLQYVKFFNHLNKIGFSEDFITKEKLPNAFDTQLKLNNFLKLYNLIKKNGYLSKGFENRLIMVLNKNYIDNKDLKDDYEIWSGHHRAACLIALGFKEIQVLLLNFNFKKINNY